MEETVFKEALQQGIFAVLFIWLFMKVTKESGEREARLMSHIERTTDTLQQIEKSISRMQTEIEDIREEMRA